MKYLIILFFSTSISYAKVTAVSFTKTKSDTGTVTNKGQAAKAPAAVEQNFMVRPYIKQGAIDLTVKPIELPNGAVKHIYKPNPGVNSGIYLKYKYVGISLGTNKPPEESEVLLKGESTFTDYQFHFAIEKIGFDLYYQKYKGFYRDSATDSEMVGDPKHYPLLQNLEQESIGVNVFYIFSPGKYSYEANFNQSEVQKQSGGSMLAFLSVNQFKIKNDVAIIPTDQQVLFGELGTFSGVKIQSVGLMVGWGHSWIYNAYFFGGVLALGPAYQKSTYEGVDNPKLSGASARATIRLSSGYNGSSYFGGISILVDATTSLSDRMEVSPSSRLAELFIGLRF